jgi:hypothetical protein
MTRKQRFGLGFFILGCSFLTAWFMTLGDKENARTILLMFLGYGCFIYGAVAFIGIRE